MNNFALTLSFALPTLSKVNIPPEIVQTSPRSSIVLKNEDFALECTAEGKPTPILSWTRNGRPLLNGLKNFMTIMVVINFVVAHK